jgi:prevent-host-death family protein
MKLGEHVRPITELKNNTAALVREVGERSEPIVITQNGEAKAVLMDVATFDSWRQALLMLKLVAQGEADTAAGRVTPHDQVFETLERELGELRGSGD